MIQSKGYALITGASSGIGATYADRLARQGYDLILVARNQHRLERLATQLNANTQRDIHVVVADLNLPADLARVEQILHDNGRVVLLASISGIAGNRGQTNYAASMSLPSVNSRAIGEGAATITGNLPSLPLSIGITASAARATIADPALIYLTAGTL